MFRALHCKPSIREHDKGACNSKCDLNSNQYSEFLQSKVNLADIQPHLTECESQLEDHKQTSGARG